MSKAHLYQRTTVDMFPETNWKDIPVVGDNMAKSSLTTGTAIVSAPFNARKEGALAPEQADWGLTGLSRVEYFRVSSMATFEQCPHTWATRWLGGTVSPDSAASIIGTAVHTVAENILRERFMGESDGDEVIAALKKIPKNEYNNCLEYCDRLGEMSAAGLLALETEFTIKMHEGMPPIRGHIDAVFAMNDGSILILDHKTNRAYESVDYWSNQLQMLLYAWAVRQMYPGRRIRFRIGYVNVGRDVEWETDPSDDEALCQRMWGLWNDMQAYAAANEWPQKINKNCTYCPVRIGCALHTEQVVNFKESTLQLLEQQKSTAEMLEHVQIVKKILALREEELEVKLALEVQKAGGRLETKDKVYTIEPGPSRRTMSYAKFMARIMQMIQLQGYEDVWPTIGSMADEIATIKVGGIDKLTEKLPGIKAALDDLMETSGGKPTLKCKEIKRTIKK